MLLLGRHDALLETLRADAGLRACTIERCHGAVSAVQRARTQSVEVVLTDPETSVGEDIALARELTCVRPGVRTIVLAPEASSQELIDALREHVFACFTAPFEHAAIADMVKAALRVTRWRDGIEVVSGLPHWLTLRVSCHLLTADRLISFMSELQAAMPDEPRDLLIAAFRELLLNAMEHGAGFDPDKVIEVTAAKTARAIVYHFRDPGDGVRP
ncbi:MAG: ATP-binding protein [Steroidobacteraceae bacterium]